MPKHDIKHVLDENTYTKLKTCINNKIQSNLLTFLKQYKMCFTEPEWKFLNDKHHEVSNFYGLPKIHKSKILKSGINSQNSKIIEIFEPNDPRLRPIVGVPGAQLEN